MLLEENICIKYNIKSNIENINKIKECLKRKIYSFSYRDKKKMNRYILLDEAKNLEDYFINITFFDLFRKNENLQKLKKLEGKKISELTNYEKDEISEYIKINEEPILLYKKSSESKLLVKKIPEFKKISYNELCDILINNEDKCYHCKCKITILNSNYNNNNLTFDSLIPIYGHCKENLVLSYSLCNSKKNFKNYI